MPASNHLSLRLVRLIGPQEWLSNGDDFSFIFPKSGSGSYAGPSGTKPLTAGDVLAVSSALGGRVVASTKGDLVFWAFSMALEQLFPLFASTELCLVPEIASAFRPSRFYAASTPIARECHKLLAEAPPQFDLSHRSHLLRVVSAVLTPEFNHARAQRCGFVRMEDHLTQVFETLSVSEILELSVSHLAERFHCSRRHLNRLFHQHFGLSIAGLRMEMRLLKAASLLRDPDAKVVNVAEQCRFNHLGLFNVCFKRRFGLSPGHWREKIAGPERHPSTLTASEPYCRMRANGLCPWSGKDATAAPADDMELKRPKISLLGSISASAPMATGVDAGEGGTLSCLKADALPDRLKVRIRLGP